MTGNKLLQAACLLLLSAASARAQLPNGTAAGPDASLPAASAPEPPDANNAAGSNNAGAAASSSPKAPKLPPTVEISQGGSPGPVSLSRPQFKDVHITYGGELTLSADQADADLAGKRYDLHGNVRIHETDTTLRPKM